MASISKKQSGLLKSGKLGRLGIKRSQADFNFNEFEKVILELIAKYFHSPNNSAKAQKILREGDHIASNTLYQTLAPEVEFGKNGVNIKFAFPDYWRGIDTKQKAEGYTHQLYLDIQEWISQKPSIQKKIPKQRRKTFAYFVAKKIGEKGVKKNSKFFTGQIDPFLTELRARLPKAFAKDLKLEVIEAIKPA